MTSPTICWVTRKITRKTERRSQVTGNNVSPAAYIQDNSRVNRQLTLNLGLRWDGIPHTYEASHLSSNFYPNLYNPANAATFDSNNNICSNNSPITAGYCGASAGNLVNTPSPGLVSESAFGGYQFYLKRNWRWRVEWYSQGPGQQLLEQLGTTSWLCLRPNRAGEDVFPPAATASPTSAFKATICTTVP